MLPIRILIIDDSSEFIHAAMHFIEQIRQVQYAAAAQDAKSVLEELDKTRPHLVLVDFSMPGVNGLETIRLIRTHGSGVRIVMLSVEDTEEHRQAAIAAGADGYISKSEFAARLLLTIQELFSENDINSNST